MDAKEAIKLLKGEPVFLNDFPEVKRRQAARLAISALEKVPVLEAENARLREKETPKKPKYINNGCNCQCCDRRLPDAILQCCPYCGQRIDWSSDKN